MCYKNFLANRVILSNPAHRYVHVCVSLLIIRRTSSMFVTIYETNTSGYICDLQPYKFQYVINHITNTTHSESSAEKL